MKKNIQYVKEAKSSDWADADLSKARPMVFPNLKPTREPVSLRIPGITMEKIRRKGNEKFSLAFSAGRTENISTVEMNGPDDQPPGKREEIFDQPPGSFVPATFRAGLECRPRLGSPAHQGIRVNARTTAAIGLFKAVIGGRRPDYLIGYNRAGMTTVIWALGQHPPTARSVGVVDIVARSGHGMQNTPHLTDGGRGQELFRRATVAGVSLAVMVATDYRDSVPGESIPIVWEWGIPTTLH